MENIITIERNNKTIVFNLNNTRERELRETLKMVGAGTHTSVNIQEETSLETEETNPTS